MKKQYNKSQRRKKKDLGRKNQSACNRALHDEELWNHIREQEARLSSYDCDIYKNKEEKSSKLWWWGKTEN